MGTRDVARGGWGTGGTAPLSKCCAPLSKFLLVYASKKLGQAAVKIKTYSFFATKTSKIAHFVGYIFGYQIYVISV